MKRKAISAQLKLRIFERDNFMCQYCGKHAHEGPLEINHIIPVALGGRNEISNLITSCRECNRLKAAKCLTPEELKLQLENGWNPRIKTLMHLAEVLGTSVGYIIGENSEQIASASQGLTQPVNELSYWGWVLNNTKRVIERGDVQEISLISNVLNTACELLKPLQDKKYMRA